MALTDSFPTQDSGGLSIADTRLVMAGLVAKNSDGTPRTGVFPSGTGPLVTGRASMGYNVAPFMAAVSRTGAGVELVANNSSTVVATTASPSSNSRIDVIWVRAQFTGSADSGNVPVFGVTQGTAAAVPTKPAIPAGALELATAEILSTTTTTSTVVITQSAPFTAAAGGVVLARTVTELNAWAAAVGSRARTIDNSLEWVREAGGWRLLPGQRLAYMTATTTNGVAGTIIGTVAKTIPLPVGQRVKVRCSRIAMYNTTAGQAGYLLALRNNSADVTYTVYDRARPTRVYQPGSSLVISAPGTETEFVTTANAPVSAALYVTSAISYGGDTQELWIESA